MWDLVYFEAFPASTTRPISLWDGMENRTVSCYLLTSTFLKEGTVLVPDIRLIHLSNRHEDRPDIHSRFSTCYVNSASKLILPIHKLHVELAPSLQVHSPFKKHSSLSRDNSLTQRDLHTAKQSPVPCSSQSSQTLGWIETKFSSDKRELSSFPLPALQKAVPVKLRGVTQG